jgi:hypothetical protein
VRKMARTPIRKIGSSIGNLVSLKVFLEPRASVIEPYRKYYGGFINRLGIR